MLDQPPGSATAGQHNAEFWIDDLRSWPDSLLESCRHIADGGEAPEELRTAIHALVRMRDTASATPRYRARRQKCAVSRARTEFRRVVVGPNSAGWLPGRKLFMPVGDPAPG